MRSWTIPREILLTAALIFSLLSSGGAESPIDVLNRHDPQARSVGATKAATPLQVRSFAPEKYSEGVVWVGTSLNIRLSPWGRIIGRFTDGDRVRIIATRGDWYKIFWNGQIAYVHANYVSTAWKKAGHTSVEYPGSGSTPAKPQKPQKPSRPSGHERFGAAPCTPMPGRTSSEWGPRSLYGRSFHHGTDLPIPTGTRLNALGDGVVTAISYEPAGGRYIKIKYGNGIESVFCHLKSTSVRVGQRVSMGQEVARSDNTGQSTGPHLHLGIRKNGQLVNPRSVPGIPLPPRR